MANKRDTNTAAPDLKLVETAPESIFDDLDALRKVATLKASRRATLVNVRVRRPPNNVYFRCHSDPAMSLDGSVITGGDRSDDYYYVAPRMLTHDNIMPRLRKVTIAVVYTWPGAEILLWPVPILGERRIDCWKSTRTAYEMSKQKWTQLLWNGDKRDYDVAIAEGNLPEPMWPADLDIQKLLKLGFADKVIMTDEHPYVLQLRGLAD